MSIINMQIMRYINLLDNASRVKTRKCFIYNDTIVFAVPKAFLSKAIGSDAKNIKELNKKLGKKIKIIKDLESNNDFERFIQDIISPIKFRAIEIKDKNMIIFSGGTQNKASLIGRNKKRLIELSSIVKDMFDLELKIV